MNPLPSRDFYDQVASVYDQRYAYPSKLTAVQAAWLAKVCPRGPLLDLGTGTGRMLPALARAGFLPVGLDCSPAMLAQARRQPSALLVRGDAGRGLPFAGGVFAAVIGLHATLIHLSAPGELEAVAAEARRVLRPGGVLVLELPHPRTYPAANWPRVWREYQPGMSCRRVAPGLEEMRLDDAGGITTLVRALTVADLKTWLTAFPRVELHPGFSGGRFRTDKGDIMVVCAWK
ncbi:MAG: class I SAM-dependent methyltransferase [Desulfarculus sp.]|nr:MAG: class I SAM-dependent methyltransferase [Desulfarculus sp.]